MADRRQQIIQLIGSRFDQLYLPKSSLVTPSGLVPGVRTPCSDCGGLESRDDFGKTILRHKGRGWILDRYRQRKPCSACGGAGYVSRDPMDSQHVRVGSENTTATARPRRTVTCDGCDGAGVRGKDRCPYCDGEGRRDLHRFELRLDGQSDADADPMAASIDRRDRSGSYHELELGLTSLSAAARRLLDDLYLPPVARDETGLSLWERSLIDVAFRFLDSRMPDPVRVPKAVRENTRLLAEHRTRVKGRGAGKTAARQRDKEIRRHARDGRSPQWIGFEYGLSVSTVYAIVNGKGVAA